MKKLYILAIGIFSITSGYAQSNNVVNDPRVKEAYNGVESEFTEAQLVWIKSILDRCEVQEMPGSVVAKQYPLLSSIPLIKKYGSNPALATNEINPLKYAIDFYVTKDQVFQIDGTNKLLIVRGKK